MPNRVIREGFLDSDRVSQIDWFAECVFHRMLLAADDAGRLDGRIDALKSRLFPLLDRLPVSDLHHAIEQIEKAGLLTQWNYRGRHVLQLTLWRKCSSSRNSSFPDRNGDFTIRFVVLPTKDGPVNFVDTSVPTTEADPLPTRSAPPADPVLQSQKKRKEAKEKKDIFIPDENTLVMDNTTLVKDKTFQQENIFLEAQRVGKGDKGGLGGKGEKPDDSESNARRVTTAPAKIPAKVKAPKAIKWEEVAFPPGTDTLEMRQAIEEWLEYRRKIGKPFRQTEKQISLLLRDHGASLPAAIRFSIAQGYQGCYMPKGGNHGDQRWAAGPGQRHPADVRRW